MKRGKKMTDKKQVKPKAKAEGKGKEKMVGTLVPVELWKGFRIACLKNDKNQNVVLIELMQRYIEESGLLIH